MLYLVTYDVPSTDNTTRDKISHTLAAAGLVRVQYSVFWGYMSRNEAESVALKVQQILGTVEGDVRVVPICQKCRTRLLQVTVTVGGGKAAIARGIATINTKHLSRPAKAFLGKGAPAIPVPSVLAGNLSPQVPDLIADGTRPASPVPSSDAFDIDVITAKKTIPPAPALGPGDADSSDLSQFGPPQVPVSQAGIAAPLPRAPLPPNPSKKPFLLI